MWLCDQLSRKSEHAEVLRRIDEKQNAMRMIQRGNYNWVGHILRHSCVHNTMIEGKIERMRGRGIMGMLDGRKIDVDVL